MITGTANEPDLIAEENQREIGKMKVQIHDGELKRYEVDVDPHSPAPWPHP